MKCRDINLIEYQNNVKPKRKNFKVKDNVGFDTETVNGKAFIISFYKNGGCKGVMRLNDNNDIFSFILNKSFMQSNNFFYNLTYDSQALFKHFDYNSLKDLANINLCRIKWKDDTILIKFIPDKLLKISYKNISVKFYDIAQFYNKISLANASNKFLTENKIVFNDIDKLDTKMYDNDIEYQEKVDAYCQQDAKLTKLLSDKICSMAKTFIIPKYFYSQASFSQQYFLENLDYMMKIPPKDVLNYALRCYQGGRFETFKRGYFNNAYIYDIKSAYPCHNINIPDVGKGKWMFNDRYMKDSIISIFRCRFNIGMMPIMPTKMQMHNNLLLYPYGKFDDAYLSKDEYELISLYTTIDVKGAWHYYDDCPVYPYRWLNKMFTLKEMFKHENSELTMMPKTMMNGFYGKTIQVNPVLNVYDKKLVSMYDSMISDVVIMKNKDNHDMLHYIYRMHKAGMLFNPVVANEITARTRCQLFKSIMNDMDKIIGFQTDSIICSDILPLDIGSSIGQWSMEKQGDLIMIGSGIYSISGKTKLRGFEKGLDMLSLMHGNTNQIVMELKRNTKLKRVMSMLYDSKDEQVNNFNLILKEKRVININFDRKRKWDRDFENVDDIMNSQISSKPLEII